MESLERQNQALDNLIGDLKVFLELSFRQDEESIQDWIDKTVNKLETRCWKVKNCEELNCPAYKNECGRCWLIAGTMCGGKPQGKFTEKYGSCTECEIYKDTFGNDRVGELKELIIALIHSLRLEHSTLLGAMDDLQQYNKEIKAAHKELQHAHNELRVMKTALENKNRLLQELSVTDRLTALYNRGYVDDTIRAEIKRIERYGGTVSVIMADIDHFKKFNDNYGHLVGDEVLGKVSQIFRKNIRSADTPGRWGGEEFIIVCPNSTEKQCAALAEKLRQLVETTINGSYGGVTCSFGVCEYEPGYTEYDLIKRADEALYKSKENGRNCVTAFSEF